MSSFPNLKVMIAGIGGASLGTEIAKCLRLAGRYEVFGCDISPTAYGLYDSSFTKTYLILRDTYIDSVILACGEAGTNWLIPGGEQPMLLLGNATEQLGKNGIRLIGNHPNVVREFSDKAETFRRLTALGFEVPLTAEINSDYELGQINAPCIVKPATGSGGSAKVFFAADLSEAKIYVDYIRRTGGRPIVQEYISPDEGEFTVGVLSLSDGELAGSIALRRTLDSKLSVLSRERGGVVSSGYSQGYIGNYAEVRNQAESIAQAIGSCGPLNIQGRLRKGRLIPFEINPRLSASTYLRALAGFNEPDVLLRFMAFGQKAVMGPIREGWYLRSLAEQYISPEELKS